MADAARVDLDADLTRAGLGDFNIGYFELFIRRWNAGDLHRGHAGDVTTEVRFGLMQAEEAT
jgi:hypothetical protein